MIQRIQTIFLILYIGALVCTFFFPVWQKISFDQNNSVNVMVTGYVSGVDFSRGDSSILYDNFFVSGLIIASCIIALISIFSYKNRLNQIKLGALNSLITSILIPNSFKITVMFLVKKRTKNLNFVYLKGRPNKEIINTIAVVK